MAAVYLPTVCLDVDDLPAGTELDGSDEVNVFLPVALELLPDLFAKIQAAQKALSFLSCSLGEFSGYGEVDSRRALCDLSDCVDAFLRLRCESDQLEWISAVHHGWD